MESIPTPPPTPRSIAPPISRPAIASDFRRFSEPPKPQTGRTATDSALASHKYPPTFGRTIERLERLSKTHTNIDIGRYAIDALSYLSIPYPEEYISCNFDSFGALIRSHLMTKPLFFQKRHYPLIAELSIRSECSTNDALFLQTLYRLAAFTLVADLATTKYAPDLPK